jgi:hypothetical protein
VRPHLEKPFTKIGLVEWLKVKAPRSSPRIKKKNPKILHRNQPWSRKDTWQAVWEMDFLP